MIGFDQLSGTTLTGLLVIDKPPGITSRKVVDAVVRLVRPAKAGHAGTLDPLATGVLVVCVGKATRLIEYVQRMPKSYRGTFLLGRSSPTEDIEGPVEELDDPPRPSLAQLADACHRLTGRIQQRPPAYSALKVAGRRAYDLARAGEKFDLKPRTITVHRLDIVQYEYPELVLDVECGSGTYIRSLGRDLAADVGTAAVMSDLRRTAIGPFTVDKACLLEQLTRDSLSRWMLPALQAVPSLPTVELSREEVSLVAAGARISREGLAEGVEWAALDPAGRLIAVMKSPAKDTLQIVRNLV